MDKYIIAGLGTLLFALIFFIAHQDKKINMLNNQIATLEANQHIRVEKLEPIIKYKDRKVEVIKKIPVYKGDNCEKKLQNIENIINSF